MKLILQIRRARRMSDVRDENKAPNTNEVNNVAKRNIQALLVKKEKNPPESTLKKEHLKI
ncbi:hypothetical protein T02_6867 [Trichinella nativa]|uniref:Uncharacterized protein n=1 Tax=Trichinella nativa TaxID=6335 RepID=A0A0V1KKV0_9BILA|nr:hypothetical protein T02_6867 [Trichinella nativa]